MSQGTTKPQDHKWLLMFDNLIKDNSPMWEDFEIIFARWFQTMHINDKQAAMGPGQLTVESLFRLIDGPMLNDELVSYCLLSNDD